MKKRITSILVALSMLLSTIPFFSAPVFAKNGVLDKGSGLTADDPILIEDIDDLYAFQSLITPSFTGVGYHYALTTDITLPNTNNWTGIDNFYGHFDGRNHYISNVDIRGNNGFSGFFWGIGDGAVVENLHIKNSHIEYTGTDTTASAGGFSASAFGNFTINNCSFEGDVIGYNYAGGLVGSVYLYSTAHDSKILNCWNSGTMQVRIGSPTEQRYGRAGALTGSIGSNGTGVGTLTFSNCATSMTIVDTPVSRAAGFFGVTWGPTVKVDNSYAYIDNYQYSLTYRGVTSGARSTITFDKSYVYHTAPFSASAQNAWDWTLTTTEQFASITGSNTTFINDAHNTVQTLSTFEWRDPDFFKTQTNFENAGWDFQDESQDGTRAVWMMNSAGTRPVLKPYLIPSYMDGVRYDYYGSTAATADNVVDLSKYIYAVNDTNYATSGRFVYSLTSTDPNPGHRFVKTDGSEYDDDGSGAALVYDIQGDYMTLDPDAPVGDYEIEITVHDNNNVYADYKFKLNIRKKYKVPVPAILTADQGKTYDPVTPLTLADIHLDPGTWFWEDPTIVPKNTDGMPASYYVMQQDKAYKAFFRLDKDASQTYNANVKANYTDYYDWSDVQTYAANNGYTLLDDTAANDRLVVTVDPLVVQSTSDPMSPEIVHIFVYDMDTNALINGATVQCTDVNGSGGPHYPDEFPRSTAAPYDSDVTANDAAYGDGYVYAEMVPGSHTFYVTASGYDPLTQTETVYATGSGNTFNFYLKSQGKPLTVPKVYLRDPVGNATYQHNNVTPTNPEVTITKLPGGSTASWVDANGVPLTSVTDTPGNTLNLPTGNGTTNIVRYMIKSSTYRCTTDDVLYMMFDSNGDPQYYTDPSCQSQYATTRDYLVTDIMAEPVYLVYIDEVAGTSPQEYTVRIDLKNIKATHGTFGLKYDPDIFDVPSTGPTITPDANNVSSILLAEDKYAAAGLAGYPWTASNGYYEFIWEANGTSGELDAERTQQTLVTFTFKLKSTVDPADASVDWFGITPWGDTDAAKAAIADTANFNNEANIINYERWRECDADNNPLNPAFGRIDRQKADVNFYDSTNAVVSNEDTKGFFQASVNPSLGSNSQAYFFDVMTEIHYGFPIENSIIRFHIHDSDPSEIPNDLDNATVDLYDTTPTLVDTQVSNVSGIAKFNINTSSGANGYTFGYNVKRQGYWDIPDVGVATPTVNAPTGKVTNVDVAMEKKIYHKPVMIDPATGVAFVGNADLGGEKYAYNGRNFHFRCKAAKGYKITNYPTSARVYIKDYNNKYLIEMADIPVASTDQAASYQNAQSLRPNSLGVFTLDKQYLDQVTLKSLSSPDYTLLQQYDSDYASYVPSADPVADGFRSYNVYIEFVGVTYEEISYRVEGRTNSKGTVQYSQSIPDNPGATNILPENSALSNAPTYSRVDTYTVNNNGSTNHLTGTFHFAGTGNNVVEKVYINGLRTYIYDGLPSFDYSFEDVDMDCNITVLFYDGTAADANQDTLMTLVVGEYGTVNTTAPDSETGLFNTRRVYLMQPGQQLEFTEIPDGGGYYKLHMVQQEVETGGATVMQNITNTVNPSTGDCSVSPVTGTNTVVYVTFQHQNPDPDTTPNLFVKSYVHTGTGVVKDAGILIYTMYDTVNIDLKTKDPFSVKEVLLQPYNDLTTVTSTTTYPQQTPALLQTTYTYPSLQSNIALGAVFAEATYALTGTVLLDQYSTSMYSAIPVQTGATVRFVRLDDTTFNEKPNQTPYVFTTSAARQASFSASIPAGWWNVYVEKPGYVTYKLTKFQMPQGNKLFGANGTTTYPVIPYIGSTTDGKYVTLNDAANIKSGWRIGVNSVVKERADVDDDGSVSINDIGWVWTNFNRRLVEQDYNNFEQSGPVTVPYP